MADRKNGLAPLPSGLFRPTTTTTGKPPGDRDRPAPADVPADEPVADDDEPGRAGGIPPARGPRPETRRKRPAVGGETRGRKLSLPDAVYDRLQLPAIQRRTTASAIAAEILDRNLPRLRIERDEHPPPPVRHTLPPGA